MRSARWSAVALTALPALCNAHAFGERYELPAPLPYFVAGAALTVTLSFAVIARATRGVGELRASRNRTIALDALLPFARRLLHAIAIALLLLVITAGAFGNAFAGENIAPTLVWVVWRVGLALFVACVGNVGPALDPWRALFDGFDALARRFGAAHGASLRKPYPAALGAWLAILLLLGVACIEVVFPQADMPARSAAWAAAWTLVMLAGMVCFGRKPWQRHADVFAIYFGPLGQFAPIAAADSRSLALRAPGSGLIAMPRVPNAVVAFILAMLATVLFDGLLGAAPWRAVERWVSDGAPFLTDGDELLLGTLSLLPTWGALLAAYVLACVFTARLLAERDVSAVAQLFAPSLVPIAIGYNFAHNFSYLVEQSRWIAPLLSDPLGRGWNLFGTTDDPVVFGIVDARLTRLVAIGAIVIGHLLAVRIAHRRSLAAIAGRRRATLASVPLTVLMVGDTALSLTIIAEPLTQFRAPGPSYSLHHASFASTAQSPLDLPAAMRGEKRVGPGEVPATEERSRRAPCRQRRWMIRGQHEMLSTERSNRRRLGLCMRAPQQEDLRRPVARDLLDDQVGERLPTHAGVAGRLPLLDRQHRIEQQHTLPRPAFEVARARRRDAEIALQFEKDVAQAWRHAHAIGHGERETVRLAGTVIRILAEDHDARGFELRQLERTERLRRKHGCARRDTAVDKRAQGRTRGRRDERSRRLAPVGGQRLEVCEQWSRKALIRRLHRERLAGALPATAAVPDNAR